MGCCRKAPRVLSVKLLLVRSLWVLGFVEDVLASSSSPSPCHFPAIYNFGDSNSDTGGISAAFEPLKPPYGRGFFHKPYGRGSDGRLIIDFIAEHLKLPYLSPYLNSLGTNYRHGANFATGGATIMKPNDSIYQTGVSPFHLGMQVIQFDQFKDRGADLYIHAKEPSERERLPRPDEFSKALYTFDIGQNDLSYGFRQKSLDQVRVSIPDMINQFAAAAKNIYERGGRSFWVHNTGPVGCLPEKRFYLGNPKPGFLDEHGCVKEQNEIAIEFNKQLKGRVAKLRAELPQAAIAYVDIYTAKYRLIADAKKLGYVDPMKVCCGFHEGYDHVWCGNKGKLNNKTLVYGGSCPDPKVFISWDGVHYTEAANKWVGDQIINGSLFTDPPIPVVQACHRQ